MIIFRIVLLLFFLSFMLDGAQAKVLANHQFTIYAYIPWHYSAGDFLKYGIQPIKVIYEKDYIDKGEISLEKIKKIAAGTLHEPETPISFDLEFGNRFKPETLIPRIKAVLNAYHRFKSSALVGIYSTIPQNTYGWKPTIYTYDKLNAKYSALINDVDFLSPSLYNYNGRDLQAWSKSAIYNIEAAKKYRPHKPVIPYISPVYNLGPSDKAKNGNLVEELEEEAMKKRLELLYDLGASGCIIWASSQDRKEDGQIPIFSPNTAWGKAVVEFIKAHSLGRLS